MSADLAIGSPRTHSAIGSPRARPDSGSDIDAAHLAPEATPRWRALLESHWRARLERVTELSLAFYDAEEASAHPAAGQPATARQARPLLREAVAERRALAEIEAALARLTNGRFGRCERCGGVVSAARLTRIPQARYCGACDH
jgi:RNA polymerase-binding transcription factor DksA